MFKSDLYPSLIIPQSANTGLSRTFFLQADKVGHFSFLPAASRSIRGYVCSFVRPFVRPFGTVSKKGESQFEGFPELLQMIKRNANLRDFPELLQFLYASTSS